MLTRLIPLLACTTLAAAEQPRVFLMGNSLTNQIGGEAFVALCRAGDASITCGSHISAGVPIDWFLKNPDAGFLGGFGPFRKAFAEHDWDVLGLQPFWSSPAEDEAAGLAIVRELRQRSPQARVALYQQWPSARYGTFASQWRAPFDPAHATEGFTGRRWLVRTRGYFTWLVDRWRAGEPQQTFIVVPVGSTLDLLDQRARAGAIPGLSDADQLYADTVHLTNVGAYAIACTWFAVLTGRDPARLPTTGYEPDGTVQGNHPLTQPLADAIRRAAWEVVATHPDSGVTDSARAPAIATPALPPAVTGCVYTHELLPAFGTPPRHWQVVSGPATIDAATGILSGTWEQPGTATVVVRLTDSSDRSADTTFPLRIEADTTPTIGDAALPTLGVGERLDCQLSVAEGNPPYTWKLAGGKLPAGIALERNGRLVGTPSAPGRASVRVAVSDGDPERPDTAMRNLELTVEDRPGTYVRVPGGAHPTVDGTLADDEGWQLDQQAGAVRFGVRWSPRGYLCVAARVTDDAVVTAKDPEAGDGLVVWIDGLNNREPIYNADDQRLLIPTSGRFTARGDLRFIQAACQRTGSELTFEAVMRLTNLAVEAKPGSCLGFDIGYRDIDTLGAAPTVTPWRGTDRNDYDPSHFGVLILGPAAR